MIGNYPAKVIFFLIWYPTHLVLVLITTVILVIVYRKIALALDEGFWAPLTGPITQICSSLCTFFQRSEENVFGIALRETEITNETEIGASNTAKNQDNTVSAQFLSLGANRIRSASVQSHSGSFSANESQLSIGGARNRSASICSVEIDFGNSNETGNNLRDKFNRKRKNNQRKINSAFFFVSFSFIIIAIPTATMVNLLVFWMIIDLQEYKIYGLFVNQILYGLVFLVNPFLYMFSNQYVMEKLRCRKRAENNTPLSSRK